MIDLAQQDALIEYIFRGVKAGTDQHVRVAEEEYRPDGKVLVSRNGLRVFLHRLLYREVVGPLDSKTFLLRTCDQERCVNPYHHRPTRTPVRPRRFCVNQHEYQPEDVNPDGTRTCRRCLAERLERRPRRGGLRQWEIQRARQFCPYGHPYVPDNTYEYPTPSGGTRRKCKTCTLARNRGEDPANVSWP